MELTLTPYSKLGKLFKKGKIEDIGNGSAEIQLAIVLTSSFGLPKSKKAWTWNYNGNVSVGSSDAINKPMNSDTAEFIAPYDAFKLKVTMHTGGEVNIKFKHDNKFYKLTLTTELLLANIGNPEVLAKTWTLKEVIPEIPKPEPIPIPEDEEMPAPDIEPITNGFFKGLLKTIDTFLNENKWWFFLGFFVVGLILNWIF